jgi:hypothetical protein
MHSILIPAIKAILEQVVEVKQVFTYPTIPNKYPAVIFMPFTVENSFDDTENNAKIYRFKLFVEVNLAGITENEGFTTILPKVVDAIITKFDEKWDGGTVDGHRVWQIIDSGQWSLVSNEKSKTAEAELTLTVKTTTSV